MENMKGVSPTSPSVVAATPLYGTPRNSLTTGQASPAGVQLGGGIQLQNPAAINQADLARTAVSLHENSKKSRALNSLKALVERSNAHSEATHLLARSLLAAVYGESEGETEDKDRERHEKPNSRAKIIG